MLMTKALPSRAAPVAILGAVVLAACGALAGCAGDSRPAVTWSGGDPQRLGADQAACHKDAADLDVNEANGYSDPRFGVTSAMAAAVGKDNPLTDQRANVRAAAFETCMNDKGWRSQ
jgi:hypothetical protein